MIKITLDEAYIFDMLSIIDIKRTKLTDEKLNITQKRFDEMCQEISDQIGKELFVDIINSPEYKFMCNSNLEVFGLIDLAKHDNGLAKLTDDANFKRYLAKIELQNKFFNDTISEVKNRD